MICCSIFGLATVPFTKRTNLFSSPTIRSRITLNFFLFSKLWKYFCDFVRKWLLFLIIQTENHQVFASFLFGHETFRYFYSILQLTALSLLLSIASTASLCDLISVLSVSSTDSAEVYSGHIINILQRSSGQIVFQWFLVRVLLIGFDFLTNFIELNNLSLLLFWKCLKSLV